MTTIRFYKDLENTVESAAIELDSSEIKYLIESGFFKLGGQGESRKIQLHGKELNIKALELTPRISNLLILATNIAYILQLEDGGSFESPRYEYLMFYLKSNDWKYIEKNLVLESDHAD